MERREERRARKATSHVRTDQQTTRLVKFSQSTSHYNNCTHILQFGMIGCSPLVYWLTSCTPFFLVIAVARGSIPRM